MQEALGNQPSDLDIPDVDADGGLPALGANDALLDLGSGDLFARDSVLELWAAGNVQMFTPPVEQTKAATRDLTERASQFLGNANTSGYQSTLKTSPWLKKEIVQGPKQARKKE